MTLAVFIPLALAWLKTNYQGLLVGALLMSAIFAVKGLSSHAGPPKIEASAAASNALQGQASAHSGDAMPSR